MVICAGCWRISIHALREEGDERRGDSPAVEHHFYPRPPRGGRLSRFALTATTSLFLSTPSARRATLHTSCDSSQATISIHALREEGDLYLLTGIESA